MNNKKVKNTMYMDIVLLFPSMMLLWGKFELTAISIVAALMLIKFDPVFKGFLSHKGSKRYVLIILISGLFFSGLSLVFSDFRFLLIMCFVLFYFIFSARESRKWKW